MKTTIEVKGYTIVIEEMEEMVQVSAMMDEEVVEEFTLEPMEGGEGEEDLKGFQDFEEEDDFEDDMEDMEEDEMEEMEEDEMEEDEEMEGALESFQTFINKPKKRK
jgi:Spy/CpxP family protein refolding chaperone